VLTVGVWEDLCCPEKSREEEYAPGTGWGVSVLMDRVTTVQRMLSSTPPLFACFVWGAELLRIVLRTSCKSLSPWAPRYLWRSGFTRIIKENKSFCGYLRKGCRLINSQTWRENCGYWRISIWCTSARLHSVYRYKCISISTFCLRLLLLDLCCCHQILHKLIAVGCVVMSPTSLLYLYWSIDDPHRTSRSVWFTLSWMCSCVL